MRVLERGEYSGVTLVKMSEIAGDTVNQIICWLVEPAPLSYVKNASLLRRAAVPPGEGHDGPAKSVEGGLRTDERVPAQSEGFVPLDECRWP